MAGSSGTYITGSGISGYIPQFNGTTTIDTSALYTLGSRLGIGSSSFAYTSTNTANVELNGTSGGILGFKRNDSARGYLWHTGDNMELANTVAGAISFNTNSATRGSISSAGVWRLHNLAGTGDRVVVASSNGTLSASTSVTGLVDTLTLSTRAWRQKGDDSLGAIIATKGSGTVTSVATGYGLSGGTITTTGTLLVDTLNIATRAWRQKGLDSLAALEVSGSGTTNYVPKFTAASTIGNSQIFDNGTNVGIGTGTPLAKLHIGNGSQSATNGASTKAQIMDGNSGGRAALLTLATSTGSTVVEGQYESDASSADLRVIMGSSTNHPVVMRTNNTERLRIFANGRIGVNTTTDAGYQFDVNGNGRYIGAASTNSGLIVQNSTGASGTAQFYMDFGTSATLISRMFRGNGLSGTTANGLNIDNFEGFQIRANQLGGSGGTINLMGGNVGVATTSPTYQLDINGTLRSVNGANFATTSGNVGINRTSTGAKLDVQAESGAWGFFLRNNVGNTTIAARNDGRFLVGNGTVDNFAVTETGNVGIGTASPAYKLHTLTSDATIAAFRNSGSANGQILVGNTAGDLSIRTLSTGDSYIFSDAGKYLDFGSNASFRVRLTSDGEMLVATTSDAGDYKLQVAGNIYNTGSAVLAATGGDVLVRGTNNPLTATNRGNITLNGTASNIVAFTNGSTATGYLFQSTADMQLFNNTATGNLSFYTNAALAGRFTPAGEFLLNTDGTDAGDYKLQVSGNALVTAGKLDITTNTAFGLSVSRSGTSVVGGQINNSNGILYYGAESSTGGSLFTGSSAYAAVIGSGAAYPLQFATNNVVRATINADGEMLIGGTDVGLYNLQVTGNAYTQTFQYVGSVLGINTGTYNSAGTAQITMKNGTNPDGSVTDQFILYSADVVAGNAAPHFRTENGGIIKLYQETTAVGAATFTANSGTAVNDASTFDGYTLKQIVKALRNQGILQ
jgi:hypothetical protein